MISQSLYQTIRSLVAERHFNGTLPLDVEFNRFLRPYVLVIHQPSGRGFYLDRDYRHLIDVNRCQEPRNPVETERHHLCMSSSLPEWANLILEQEEGTISKSGMMEFDSFWLY